MTPEQKSEFLKQALEHFEADTLIKGAFGRYDDGFKGCSVGCHLHHIMPGATAEMVDETSDKHRRVADYYGYPEWLAHMQDTIFEGLPDGDNRRWHVQLAETLYGLPDDYDWQKALHRVHLAILRIAYQHAGEFKVGVRRVMDLHRQAAAGDDVSAEQWNATASAASGAANAARGAAAVTAAGAAESAAWNAAWNAAYQEIRDGVLSALAEAVQCTGPETTHPA